MTSRRADALGAVLASALTLALAAWVLKLWKADLGVPFEYFGDAGLMQIFVKGIVDHGWFEQNPSLGAPHGLELYDYPLMNGDTLDALLVKLLGLVSDDSALVMNLFFLLTFPLVALTAFVVFRRLGLSRGVAVLCSVLYGLAPYHFFRFEDHLFLAAYYAVPFGSYLVLAVLGGEELFAQRAGGGRGVLGWASRRTALTLGACAVVAAASSAFYYAGFTVLLVVAATVLRFVVTRRAATVAVGAAVVAAIVVVCAVELAPTIVYRLQHGTNSQVAHRFSFESEYYSLKLADLVLPLPTHRINPLGDVTRTYREWPTSPPTEGRDATLGLAATVGFVWLIGVALAGAVGFGVAVSHRAAAVAAVFTLLVATTGGLSSLLGGVYPQFRAWNRLSIFIAFFGLLGLGLLLEALRRRLGLRWARAFPALLAVVLAVAVLDQTSDGFVPSYAGVEARYRADADFIGTVERELPRGAAVFQLPYVSFPEAIPPGRLADYEQAVGYLHSSDLRWSYGAMRGRPEDFAATVAAGPPASFVPTVQAAGFRGVLVARGAYEDEAEGVERELRRVLGRPPRVSGDGRFSFFRLGGGS